MAKKKIKGASLEQAMPSSPSSEDYETKSHLNTLMDAHGIMSDPEKMAKVHKLAGRHAEAIAGIKAVGKTGGKMKSLAEVKEYAQKHHGGPGGGPKDDMDGDE